MDSSPDARPDAERPPRRTWTRRLFLGALGAAGIGGGTLAGFGYALSTPPYRGPRSDHFDGEVFFNPGAPEASGFLDMVRWMTNRDEGAWREWVEIEPAAPPPRRVDDLRITFVNHSTVLIQIDGLNILTDPVWSHRVSPFSWIGPERHKGAGIRFEDLPPIDVVLLSHNHYDHLDEMTMHRLMKEHSPRVVAPLGVGLFLEKEGIAEAVELDWWDDLLLERGVRLHAVPAFHFSNRGMFDRNTSLWCGYVLEGRGGPVYFAGDTGYGPFFREIASRFPQLRVAMLPIGAYRPEWFMAPVHMSPRDAVRAHQELHPRVSMGIHFGTWMLADDGEREPIEDLHRALDGAGIPRENFVALENGGVVEG